ncbi:xanthine dehydrogenase family protein subunit M [Actinomycetota bacterium]|jgi:carbon-monoxide dehydrogenase medium subunit|nr:xanthine dehydrogenase family protein subunit M [Actinomycetota bacterium]MDA9334362.1 xanthine dehydrogenase family protein subunit M [Actinomycetota bacterium]MDC1474378.1 xanthine dehydrogenase family protein subunit M [Candidatus Nanopelagicales bacterium]HBK38415.1 carbon monoxide dehydrogenase [Actinomycetota bacterium]
MIPVAFDYKKASSVEDALAALAEGGEDAKLMGGGQSLVPVLRLRLNAPSVVVDCSSIPELKGIKDEGGKIVIGAGTTHHAVMNDPAVKSSLKVLADATASVADPQIRHRGTLGGALAHSDPRADQPPVALALDAEFTIAGATGQRCVAAADFFQGPFETAVGPDEILVSIAFPKLDGWGGHYEKFNRAAQAWSIIGVAAAVRMEGGKIAEARIGLTNVGGTPHRASAVEQALVGASSIAEVEAASMYASDNLSPFADEDADVDYRLHLARVLTARSVAKAAGIS